MFMTITLAEVDVILLADRAAFLEKSRSLVIADLHLGKAATFRAAGLAVPEGHMESDMARLFRLMTETNADRLIIAGDMIHAAEGLTEPVLDLIARSIEKIGRPVILTEGNHDQRARRFYNRLPVEIVPQLETDGLVITHEPDDLAPAVPGICGHLHPGIKLKQGRRTSHKVPGFALNHNRHLVLPAFSEFTGIYPVEIHPPKHRFFAPVQNRVVELRATA